MGFGSGKIILPHPNISDWVLDKLFGERAEEVKAVYLDALGMDWYALKPEYDTQRKVEAAFCREVFGRGCGFA